MSHIYNQTHYHTHHRVHVSGVLGALIAAAGGVVTLLLGTRFVLSVLQVDRLGSFASFVYSTSYPFVAPFFSLFNYQQQMGVLKFEFQTLIAIVFWALSAWLLARLISPTTNEES